MFDEIFESYEESFRKWTELEKTLRKRSLRRAHKGTNWNSLKPKSGFKRYKVPGTKRYLLVRQSVTEKSTKRIIGRKLGKSSFLRK
jgi:hypothetical protein